MGPRKADGQAQTPELKVMAGTRRERDAVHSLDADVLKQTEA